MAPAWHCVKRSGFSPGSPLPLFVLPTGIGWEDLPHELVFGYPPIAGRPGRLRRRFAVLLADKGYSSEAFRQAGRVRGSEPIIPKPKTPGTKGLGKPRYVVEQAFALLHRFRVQQRRVQADQEPPQRGTHRNRPVNPSRRRAGASRSAAPSASAANGTASAQEGTSAAVSGPGVAFRAESWSADQDPPHRTRQLP